MRNSYPDLRSGFQSRSRLTLNSVFLWSIPPYSPNFIQTRPVVYEKSCKQTNKQITNRQKILAIQRFELSTLPFLDQCSYRPSYRAVLSWLLLSDYYYSPYSPNFIKIRRVVHEKKLSGCQIRISIRITPNFELGLPMIITSLLTKFH